MYKLHTTLSPFVLTLLNGCAKNCFWIWYSRSVFVVFVLGHGNSVVNWERKPKYRTNLPTYCKNPSRAPQITPVFWWGSVFAHHFSFLWCLIMCLFVLLSVLGCSYNFSIKTMFGSSLPPVVCKRTHVLFTSFMFVCVSWCPTHIVLCCFLLCLSSSCVLCT